MMAAVNHEAIIDFYEFRWRGTSSLLEKWIPPSSFVEFLRLPL
jgi:hypothetical protein